MKLIINREARPAFSEEAYAIDIYINDECSYCGKKATIEETNHGKKQLQGIIAGATYICSFQCLAKHMDNCYISNE